ncbi:MAG: DEAD/DEAH box helicase [Gammaproteobacteria bacterium]|nr:DEAD/DEAH box helicase [Gammaproteobacteria bacterium]
MRFSSLGLVEPLLRAIEDNAYNTPSPVQVQAIPAILQGRDVLVAAQTGTGKTASFVLPLLQCLSKGGKAGSNQARALILVPTRELAQQVADSVVRYGCYLPLRSAVVFGGVKINPQMMRLRKGVDVLVATPGRLLDLYHQNAIHFDQLESLVLDEADRMLDLGFMREVQKILALLPKKRQNLLFSATLSESIRTLSQDWLNDALQVDVTPRKVAAKMVRQAVYEVDKAKKPALLSHLVRDNDWNQVLVFTRTKRGADRLVQKLVKDGVSSVAIHGDKSQGARTRALSEFKSGVIRVLVATDIVARGIDIIELACVINLDLPKVAEDYVHRIGRSGRAGCEGLALSLVSADEVDLLAAIENRIGQTLVRELETGFVPTHNVPLTILKPGANKPKKPKKPKKHKVPRAKNKAANNQSRQRRSTRGKP